MLERRIPQRQAIAEDGSDTLLIELATSLGAQLGDAGVAIPADASEPGPFGPGASASLSLSTTESTHALRTVNRVICANDGFVGLNFVALPVDSTPVTLMAVPYDARRSM